MLIRNLRYSIVNKGGRNNSGKITLKGRGYKKKFHCYRVRKEQGILGTRNIILWIGKLKQNKANIALVRVSNSMLCYTLSTNNVPAGTELRSGFKCRNIIGNSLPLFCINLTVDIHNVEHKKRSGSCYSRAAGTHMRVMRKHSRLGFVTVKLPSKKLNYIEWDCVGTVGQVSNETHFMFKYGTAGNRRRAGFRPRVRGVAMNPVDHPMGGGEGKSSGGRPSCSPWGWKTKGPKTRSEAKRKNSIKLKNRLNKFYD